MIPGVFSSPIEAWQMTCGERAAYEGVLAFTWPGLAVEVGTARGGSLERTAAYARHVHSFDLALPGPDTVALPNVTFHTGDSHDLLSPWLETAVRDGAVIGFAHVDGDHETEGAARDIADLLGSPAFDGIMLIHDSANPGVRAGIDLALSRGFPGVAYVDYDFVPGRMGKRQDAEPGQVWGGIALIAVDRSGQFRLNREWASQGIRQDRFYSIGELLDGATR
jgi:methyltransferase family protein